MTDYSIGDTQLSFQPNLQPQMSCTIITAADDNRLEEVEALAFTLGSSDQDVVIGLTSVTTVTISDSTGEYIQYLKLCYPISLPLLQ